MPELDEGNLFAGAKYRKYKSPLPGREEAAPMDILEVLGVAGAALRRVVLAPLDRPLFNRETVREIAETGAYMSYDMFGEFPSGYYPHNPAANNSAPRTRITRSQMRRCATMRPSSKTTRE